MQINDFAVTNELQMIGILDMQIMYRLGQLSKHLMSRGIKLVSK